VCGKDKFESEIVQQLFIFLLLQPKVEKFWVRASLFKQPEKILAKAKTTYCRKAMRQRQMLNINFSTIICLSSYCCSPMWNNFFRHLLYFSSKSEDDIFSGKLCGKDKFET
jgi:hypothetical protein